MDLFNAGTALKRKKQEKLEAAMDHIRGKFGTGAIAFGASQPEKREEDLLHKILLLTESRSIKEVWVQGEKVK